MALKRIWQHFGSLQTAWEAPTAAFKDIEGLGKKAIAAIAEERTFELQDLLAKHDKHNPQYWTPEDEDYPRLLLEIPSSPPILYYRGQVKAEENQGRQPMVAIVGTREPTDYGRRWTRKISQALAQHGFIIVSGMATGIDGEAHRACLAAGQRTIAVFGTGVDIVYPPSHQGLYREIEQQGLILSEYPAGTKGDRSHFPARNRIIAGLSRAVLVMEAPQKSGALITVRYANEFGREVYTLPGSLDNEQAMGCLALLSRGANVILNEGHLLEMLGAMPQLELFASPPTAVPPAELEPELAEVLNVLSAESLPLDLIVDRLGRSTSEVSAALLQLELLGLVTQAPGMRYRRS